MTSRWLQRKIPSHHSRLFHPSQRLGERRGAARRRGWSSLVSCVRRHGKMSMMTRAASTMMKYARALHRLLNQLCSYGMSITDRENLAVGDWVSRYDCCSSACKNSVRWKCLCSHFIWRFYRAMLCTVRTMLSQDVCLSVCLSVTRRYCVEMAKHIIRLFPSRVATSF